MDTAKPATSAVHLAREPMITVLGVDYLHVWLEDGSDLYITEYGRPFSTHLLPENYWADKEWFDEHSVRLPGTSAIYRITTKEVGGTRKDIVLKWNRMGQDIPGETEASDLTGAEFNSPFEEFSLLIEMRNTCGESPGRVYTHRPLGIYVPRRYVDADRLGRKSYRFESVQRRHGDIVLDANRRYAVIYDWIKGIDAAEAFGKELIDERTMEGIALRSRREMRCKGFRVRDSKPHHVILRPKCSGKMAKDRDGRILYAVVDFELLARTPQREQAIRESKRKSYLVRQAHRFETKERFPPGLNPVTIMGVDYVYGEVESTGGMLWVVGRDPVLFDYFLPEKWRRTPRIGLSKHHEVYYTVTKDSIRLVWRVSKVGQRPDVDPLAEDGRRAAAYGYNSPFEEIAFSMELAAEGIATTYPRAVYMTGHKSDTSDSAVDGSRYESHRRWTGPDGHPILSPHHDYMTVWGYWNGPDEMLAVKDEEVYRGINATAAREGGLLTQDLLTQTMQTTAERLSAAGIEDLHFKGNHLLLSVDRSGRLVTDERGIPSVRICNFELLRRVRLQSVTAGR